MRRLILFFVISLYLPQPVFAGGITFVGAATTHCELWSDDKNDNGRRYCRRRAETPSSKPSTCRLKGKTKKEGIWNCVYKRAGWKRMDKKMSMEPGFACPGTVKCWAVSTLIYLLSPLLSDYPAVVFRRVAWRYGLLLWRSSKILRWCRTPLIPWRLAPTVWVEETAG